MRKRTIIFTLFAFITFYSLGQSNDKPLKNTLNDPMAVTPPDLDRNYDDLLSRWGTDVKYASDCQSLTDEAISFSDTVYANRLYSLPTRMELVFNPLVRSYIEMYAGRRRNQVSYMLGEGKYYFPLFEEALDREGLPLELKYLPVIESALNPIARSRVGATGLWQFMAPTGRMYDLEINSLVDERRDPVKSTNAAVKYLKDLYSIYNDWNLVIAAYNCGPGNVNKAIRRSGGATDYWTIYPYLPKETRGYVPIFIAATYIMNYHNEHNICPALCCLPASMDSVSVDKNIHFQQISEVLDIPVEDIRKYNPQFTNDIIPGNFKPYALNLPIHKATAFIENRDTIIAYRAQELLTHRKIAGVAAVSGGIITKEGTAKTYQVKRGDTLGKIASRNGITLAQLKKWNGLKSNKVPVGRYLTVGYTPKKEVESSNETLASNDNNSLSNGTNTSSNKTRAQVTTTYYKVKKGDTWAGVAKKNNATINEIKKWNGIKSNSLIAGKSLKIQKTIWVPIVEDIAEVSADSVSLSLPDLAIVEIDSTYTAGLIGDYLQKLNKNEEQSPAISIDEITADEADNSRNTEEARIIYHKVKIGETITQIASHYNVTKKDIQKWNKLSSNTAKVGQRLLIKLPEKNKMLDSGSNNASTENSLVVDKQV